MAITDSDIRFRASERMTDFDDGGGPMSDVVIVDGVDNNLFPDITDLERLTGKVSLRKIYAAVFNADDDTFLSSHVVLDIPPTDADTSAVVFSTGGLGTERLEAEAALQNAEGYRKTIHSSVGLGQSQTSQASWTGGSGTLTLSAAPFTVGWLAVTVGQIVAVNLGGVTSMHNITAETTYAEGTSQNYSVTPVLPGSGAQTGTALFLGAPTQRCYGVAGIPGTTSSGATSVVTDGVWIPVAPIDADTAYPAAENPAWGIDVLGLADTHGRVPIIVVGDPLLIHHTEGMAPDTVANSDVVATGRTALSRLRVIGSTGVEHARFTDGQPAPSGVGCTADLAAGTVTFTDVSGMAQPVVVEHRIEEMAMATSVTPTTVGLNRALSREYPAGSRVSSLLVLGDLQGRASGGFAQQAWTGAWSDSVTGGVPVGDYNKAVYPIECTNDGAVSERWAVIFTNTTAFKVIGETLGEIGTGGTGSDFSPNNPTTSAPFFTIPAAGWGSGWTAGNVYRFNTIGAQAPVWALRCVVPSTPSGDDSVTLQMRGYVNT